MASPILATKQSIDNTEHQRQSTCTLRTLGLDLTYSLEHRCIFCCCLLYWWSCAEYFRVQEFDVCSAPVALCNIRLADRTCHIVCAASTTSTILQTCFFPLSCTHHSSAGSRGSLEQQRIGQVFFLVSTQPHTGPRRWGNLVLVCHYRTGISLLLQSRRVCRAKLLGSVTGVAHHRLAPKVRCYMCAQILSRCRSCLYRSLFCKAHRSDISSPTKPVDHIPDYDGGDCCECTCLGGEEGDDDYKCGRSSEFSCIDPAAPCVDDDDITADIVENYDYVSGSGQRKSRPRLVCIIPWKSGKPPSC